MRYRGLWPLWFWDCILIILAVCNYGLLGLILLNCLHITKYVVIKAVLHKLQHIHHKLLLETAKAVNTKLFRILQIKYTRHNTSLGDLSQWLEHLVCLFCDRRVFFQITGLVGWLFLVCQQGQDFVLEKISGIKNSSLLLFHFIINEKEKFKIPKTYFANKKSKY